MYIMYVFIQYKCAYIVLCYRNSVPIRIETALPVHIIKSDSDYFNPNQYYPSETVSIGRKLIRIDYVFICPHQ